MYPSFWPSFIEIGVVACITPAWSSHEHSLKFFTGSIQEANFAVYEDICKDLYEIRQSQMPSSAKHDPIVYLLMLKYSPIFNSHFDELDEFL